MSIELDYLKLAEKSVSKRLWAATEAFNKLSEQDTGKLSSDGSIVSLRAREKALSDKAYYIGVQQDLLKQLINTFSNDPKYRLIKVPVFFAKYIDSQYKKSSYSRSRPGVLVQDMFMSLADESLPKDVNDWIQVHPEDAINAIMNENYQVE